MHALFPRRPGRGDGSPDAHVFVPLARLATLSETLAAQPLGPRTAFRDELRARLLAEVAGAAPSAATSAPTAPTPSTREVPELAPVSTFDGSAHRHPALRVAAAGVALVLVGGGIAAAAAGNSLPGDALHPLKRFTESARTAADPHRDSPTHVLQQVDVRISELERSSRLGGGGGGSTTPTGVPLERWPAMQDALADIWPDLGRLAPQESDPSVRAALAQRRQRLVAVLPALTVQQRPDVERLVAVIDAMTGPAGVSGIQSLPTALPIPSSSGLAITEGVGDVLGVIQLEQRGGSAVRTREARSSAATGSSSSSATSRSARPASNRTATVHGTSAAGTAALETATSGTGISRTATSAASATKRTASQPATATVRTVTVTVTTVTTTTSGAARSAASGSLPSATVGPVATSHTVSTTTRTVTATLAPRTSTGTAPHAS